MNNEIRIFVSYAHADEAGSRGRVRRIAEDIAGEYRVLSGHDLRVFFDRNSDGDGIRWGENWREAIDSGLHNAAVLIAFISPSFLRSDECRREFMQFVRAAETTNSEDLVLPILFSDIKGTRTAVVDTVAARAEDLQWEDFTVLRHSSDDDADYRHAISSMAARIRGVLAKIDDAAEVAARSARETEPQNNEAEGPGVADLIAIAEVQVEDLGVFLELLAEYLQKISSEFEEATSLLTDAQSFAKRVRIYRRLAADISDDVEAMCEASDAFASSVIAAAPGVDAILEMLEADDSQSPESLTLASDIVTLAREMLQGFDHASTFQAQLTPLVGQSRDMRPQVVKMSDAVSRMLSVRPTFEHWLTRAADLSTKYAHGSGVD